ncbi:hypothetical protein ACFV1C_04005 [Streptomyces sp. NPDC059605]|uniref:hypothetical protein n=1 Tax=unclassified Streptomyces TaxID=2593676 RepID=UPI0036A7B7C6
MQDDEIRAGFDGRARVELRIGLVTAASRRRIEEIAHALGYRLITAENLAELGTRLVHERDDGPIARRRAELTIARLRAGGPLLPAVEPPPPPPPGPPPPAPSQARPRRPDRPRWGPPPPPPLPATEAPARPRFPPPPSVPPPPGPPPRPPVPPTS